MQKIMNDITNNSSSIGVVVVSCDNYSDLWEPFFSLFKRFWQDCQFPVYLISNYKEYKTQGVISIPVGEDVSWSDNLLTALDKIKEEFILMWIDDLFLLKKVNTETLECICKEFVKVEGNYLRLNPTVKADSSFNEYFGVTSKGTVYRASTVLSLWRKDVLQKLLKPGESAWDFEIYGTLRSDKYGGFYAAYKNHFSVLNCVIKGKWQRNALKKISLPGIDIDADKRSVMTIKEQFITELLWIRNKIFMLVPSRYRRQLKDFLLRGKYKYKIN